MEFGELVHIFATDECNHNCAFCFREFFSNKKENKLLEIAKILSKNPVHKVVIGGGEPTLVKDLDESLAVLKKSGICVELHTNGSTLDYKRLVKLKNSVDIFGIPIDTLDSKLQGKLGRGRNHVAKIKKISEISRELDFKVGYHTVATYLNIDKLPELYSKFIKDARFEYWNIYEFNENLARLSNFQSNRSNEQKAQRHNEIQAMRGPLNYQKGLTDGLLAKFLLTDARMSKLDHRIEFVDVQSSRAPYFFVNTTGDTEFYTWFSQKRTKMGNLLEDGFAETVKKLRRADKQGPMFDENDFIAATNDLPVFARLYEGNYSSEELEDLKPEYREDVRHLARLWEIKKYGAPMTD